MKIETEKGIFIELTKEQLESIESQKNSNLTIFDKVKSYQDACNELKISINFNASTYEKLKVVIKALNEGVKIDFSNKNQEKWYPYFKNIGSGWSLGSMGSVVYLCSSSFGEVGYVTSKEKAEYLGTQFFDLYKDILESY